MAKILVIDDEDQVRTYLRKLLKRAGHHVIEAADGEKGLKLYQDESADVIITDLIMPGKEGLETIMAIRSKTPDAKIIAISGGGQAMAGEYLNLAKGLGALHTLAKPFTQQKLLNTVKNVLTD